MRNGTMRFQSQYLRMIRVPAQSSLDEALCNALRTAFRERDREGATRAAMQAYGLTALPNYRGQ